MADDAAAMRTVVAELLERNARVLAMLKALARRRGDAPPTTEEVALAIVAEENVRELCSRSDAPPGISDRLRAFVDEARALGLIPPEASPAAPPPPRAMSSDSPPATRGDGRFDPTLSPSRSDGRRDSLE